MQSGKNTRHVELFGLILHMEKIHLAWIEELSFRLKPHHSAAACKLEHLALFCRRNIEKIDESLRGRAALAGDDDPYGFIPDYRLRFAGEGHFIILEDGQALRALEKINISFDKAQDLIDKLEKGSEFPGKRNMKRLLWAKEYQKMVIRDLMDDYLKTAQRFSLFEPAFAI